jgi:hypothetical protein
MAHFVATNIPLTSKAISKESEKAVKFEAKTVKGSATITAIKGAASITLLTPGAVITTIPGIIPAGTTIVGVNVGKTEAVLSQPAEKAEAAEELEIATPVFKPYIFTSKPVQTDFAEYIAGVVSADKGGTLEIQQTFGYPADHENDTKAAEGITWVPSSAAITVVEKVGQAFQVYTYAPYFRLVYTNGETAQGTFALQARAQEKGRL